MLTIIIEKQEGWKPREIFKVERGDDSSLVTHEFEDFYKTKPVKKKIPVAEYQKIAALFEALDFLKIFKEGNDGLDGWTLQCTLQNGISAASVTIWCPEKDQSKPETTKLLEACEKVFSLFESACQNLPDSMS